MIMFWRWKTKLPDNKWLSFPKRILRGRDKIWSSFGLPVLRPVPFPRHHASRHTRRCEMQAVSCLFGSSDPSCYLPLCYATISDPIEALSMIVFCENLWPVKFSLSLSFCCLSYHSTEPSFAQFPQKSAQTLFFSFSFSEVKWPSWPQSAVSSDHSSDCSSDT